MAGRGGVSAPGSIEASLMGDTAVPEVASIAIDRREFADDKVSMRAARVASRAARPKKRSSESRPVRLLIDKPTSVFRNRPSTPAGKEVKPCNKHIREGALCFLLWSANWLVKSLFDLSRRLACSHSPISTHTAKYDLHITI